MQQTNKSHHDIKKLPKWSQRIIADLESDVNWYKDRYNKLSKYQKYMRDPERTLVCDILANGCLMTIPPGRYGDISEKINNEK